MGAVSNLSFSLFASVWYNFVLGWRDHRVNPNPSSNCDSNFERRVASRVELHRTTPHRIASSVAVAVDVDVEVDTGPH